MDLLAAFGRPTGLAPRAVGYSSEFERIKNLPSRTWDENDPRVMELTFQLSAWLRRRGSVTTLRPAQAIALFELYHYGYLICPLPVGAGKTLITYLAPVVREARRAVLIVPGKLRGKTQRDFEKLSKDWYAPVSLTIFSAEQISRDYGADVRIGDRLVAMSLLDLADPDLLIRDESHKFKNPRAARTVKMARFVESRKEQGRAVPNIDLSGTFTRNSLRDHAHIDEWTMGEMCPAPRNDREISDWCSAIDVHVDDADRLRVGALLSFATPEEIRTLDPVTAARRGYRRRFMSTPGVVSFGGEYQGSSLSICEMGRTEESKPKGQPKFSARIEADFERLRTLNELPNGETTSGGIDSWGSARRMSRGFYRRWNPEPPVPWKEKRRQWHAAVREIKRYTSHAKHIDSEWQVANACVRHADDPKYQSDIWKAARASYHAWKAIEPEFDTEKCRETIWIDDAALQYFATWLEKHKGVCFVDSVEFGERLSEVTGRPYFGAKGIHRPTRTFIDDATHKRFGSIIASLEANYEGRNLQYEWSESCWAWLPKGAHVAEQLAGRMHREGQRDDEVSIDVAILCREDWNAWNTIMVESPFIADTSPLGAKVLWCDKDMPTEDEIDARAGAGSWRFAK